MPRDLAPIMEEVERLAREDMAAKLDEFDLLAVEIIADTAVLEFNKARELIAARLRGLYLQSAQARTQ